MQGCKGICYWVEVWGLSEGYTQSPQAPPEKSGSRAGKARLWAEGPAVEITSYVTLDNDFERVCSCVKWGNVEYTSSNCREDWNNM